MINSASSQQGLPSTTAIGVAQTNLGSRPAISPSDRLSTAGAELLRSKLASEPEIRPEMVARGRALAADSSYPSTQVIGDVARKILQSPDPSEDLS
jgi:hypothetical protein